MKKYEPLTEYLKKCDQMSVTLSYEEIEKIIGTRLPEKSPYLYQEWWANDKTHSQGTAWLDAGYKVTDAKLGHSVTFKKTQANYTQKGV